MADNTGEDRSLIPSENRIPARPPHPLDGEWYIHLNSETYGPYSGHQIKDFIADGRVTPDTDVLRKGASEWSDAIADRALATLFPRNVPAPAPRVEGATAAPVTAAPGATVVQVTNNVAADRAPVLVFEDGPARPKSAGTALVLSILIVGLGQIYNGQVGKGILMFILCIGLWFVLLGWIINIWSWIDAYQTASRMNERYYRRFAAGAVV